MIDIYMCCFISGDQPNGDDFDSLLNQKPHKDPNIDFIPYIVECIKSYEANVEKLSTSSMIRNLSAAIVLQYNLMQYDEKLREEIVSCMNQSFATFSALQRLTSLLCIVHFEGT